MRGQRRVHQRLVIAILVARAELQMRVQEQSQIVLPPCQDDVLIRRIPGEDDVVGIDPVIPAAVQTQQDYTWRDVRFGERFVEIYTETGEGQLTVDYGRLHETEGLTMFLVEQNVPAALDLADRGYVLQTGRVVLEGQSDELRGSDLVRRAYLGM